VRKRLDKTPSVEDDDRRKIGGREGGIKEGEGVSLRKKGKRSATLDCRKSMRPPE